MDAGSTKRLFLVLSVLPALILALAAFYLQTVERDRERLALMAEQARLVASAVDLRLERLLNLTRFCATSPALVARWDPASITENCGRYGKMLGAWVVVVTLGDTHRQILNTRPDAPAVLPSYPRTAELPTLLSLEARSKESGQPGIAEVFTGKIYPGGIVSAGQWVRLHDGREAMLYVSMAAKDLSTQLMGLAGAGPTIFGLVDTSERIVARSEGIERYMFIDAAPWMREAMETDLPGALLHVPGPPEIGSTWDAGYHPLSVAPEWMAVAVQPDLNEYPLWRFFSLESAMVFLGIGFSGILIWVTLYRSRIAGQLIASEQARQEAESRRQDKSRLLASFAHDVRSPLVSMIGSLALMEESDAPSKEQLTGARSSAEALLQLVDDILELSFLGSGQFVLRPSPVDLRKLVADLEAQIRIRAGQKRLSVSVNVDETVPAAVELDRLRLQQVLGNLLTNAVKYTEAGGVTLQISSGEAQNGEVELTFSVHDTGVGIAPQDVGRVFSEFGRLDRPIERRETGTGLGLAICKRILRAMDSDLELKSHPGKGSTFSFRLRVPVARGAPLLLEAKPLSGLTILYAEDEPIIRKVTSRQLADAGATVIEAANGASALATLRSVTPDLLLLDIQMPDLDGVATIELLQETVPERRFPVFVLTSHISGPKAAEARAAGADEVFTKPVQILPLAAALLARRGDRGQHTPGMGGWPGDDPAALIDKERFSLLAESDGRSLTERYLPEFETQMREDLAVLERNAAERRLVDARALSHRCLGICLVLGAQTLAARLKGIEEAAEEGNEAETARLGQGLIGLLDATLQEMHREAAEQFSSARIMAE